MYIFAIDVPSLLNDAIPLLLPASFSLNMSGALCLAGGDNALSAIVTTHVYGNKRWLGWYNTPGSLHISERLGSFAKSAPPTCFLADGVHTDPRALLMPDAWKGPKFRAARSGTVMEETGYLAALFMKECAVMVSEERERPGRKSQCVRITIANLDQAPKSEIRPTCNNASAIFFASVPIAASVGTCALSAASGDLWASLLIFAGIFASGISCLVLGSADFVFTHHEPAKGSPDGDGILGTDTDMVLLKGEEGAVNAITRGKFSLRFSSTTHYNLIQCCSHLFLIQSILQLLLIPQVSLFGQIMFLISLGVSALYNMQLSSVDIHRKFLFEQVLENPRLSKYTLGTRTSAVVFILLVLQPQDPKGLLNGLLPNDTKVWKQWKEMMLEYLPRPNDTKEQRQWKETKLERLPRPNHQSPDLGDLVGYQDGTQQEKDLSVLLYEDAGAAFDRYKDHLQANSP